MKAILLRFLESIPPLNWVAVLDILLVAIVLYQLLALIRGRRAAHIIVGIATIGAVYAIALAAGLDLLRTILETLAPYTAFGLIVMFQSEIRRMLARIGERPWASFGSRFELREVTDEVLLAVQQLMQHKTGALIVIERDIGLRTFIESGVPVDARVTRDLLLAIFQPGGALHDGAVIVQGGRLAAAACFLPLTMSPELSRTLGTRHRAGLGVTEESDCLAIIVSEERGTVSIGSHGELETDVSIEILAQRLGRSASRRRTVRPPEPPKEPIRL